MKNFIADASKLLLEKAKDITDEITALAKTIAADVVEDYEKKIVDGVFVFKYLTREVINSII